MIVEPSPRRFEEMTFQIVTSVPDAVLDITPVPREVRVVDTRARLAWRLKPRDFVVQKQPHRYEVSDPDAKAPAGG